MNDPTTEVPAIRLLGGDLILTDPDSGAPVAWTVTHPDVVCGAQPTERIVLIDYVTADGTAGCHEFEASDPVTVRARSHREAA